MIKCNLEQLEAAMASIRTALAEETEWLKGFGPILEQLKASFNPEAVNYCLEKYITAELDFQTPGDRGLGRISTSTPRLGAYFREQMSRLADEDRLTLYSLIQDIMIRGYLVHALFMVEKGSAKSSSVSDLYEVWIPGIYAKYELGKDVINLLTICSESAIESLNKFFNKHGMKRGFFLFRFFSKIRINSILFYYAVAGYGLRLVEVREK